MDKQRLARIDGLLNEMVEKKMAAGVNALVIQGGVEQYYGQAGYADVEAGKLMQRDSIFRMFSMSKPVTAAAAMILVERGVIDLESIRVANTSLIETLTEVQKIQREGAQKRAEASIELGRLEKQLRDKVLEINSK